jgi:cytochrome c oxidase assembly protein subunit 17
VNCNTSTPKIFTNSTSTRAVVVRTDARARPPAATRSFLETTLLAATAAKERSVQTQRAHMGASASKVADAKPKKICCACPITKNARDACIPEHDEEKCKYLIEAHKQCLRDEGFDV